MTKLHSATTDLVLRSSPTLHMIRVTLAATSLVTWPSAAHAQFWKKVAEAAVNPIGFAQQQIVQNTLGGKAGQVAGAALNPASVVVQNSSKIVDGMKDYVHAAAQSGIMAVGNSFNPAFVQTVFAMKELRRRGILGSEKECRGAANMVGRAVLAEAGLSTDPAAQWWTNSLGDAACQTSENMLQRAQQERAAIGLPTPPVPANMPYNAVFQAPTMPLASPIGRCFDPAQPAARS
jgi:hypothetical protein